MTKELYWIFKAGSYPQGEFTVAEVKQISDNYDPEFCEAPLWVGHPSFEVEPEALAWVGGCQSDAEGKLYAWFSYISPELVELINTKKFKRVSIELWKFAEKPGWYLYAIGLTNRAQIKDLKPMEFCHGGFKKFENTVVLDKQILNIPLKFSFDKKKFTNQNTKKMVSIDELKSFGARHGIDIAECKNDSEIITKVSEFIDAAVSAKETAEAKVATFGDQTKTLEEQIAAFKLKDVEHEIEIGIAEKRLLPSQKEAMLKQFGSMENGAKAAKDFISTLPVQTIFNENVIDKDSPGAGVQDANKKFFKADGTKLTYIDLLAETKKNPRFADNFTDEEIKKLRKETYE